MSSPSITETDPARAAAVAAGAAPGGPARERELPHIDPDAYELLGELARGGMGRISRARDRLGRVVAVKQLRPVRAPRRPRRDAAAARRAPRGHRHDHRRRAPRHAGARAGHIRLTPAAAAQLVRAPWPHNGREVDKVIQVQRWLKRFALDPARYR